MQKIYFDNSATTKIYEESLQKYVDVSNSVFENSAALHTGGFEAEKEIETARNIIAKSLGVSSSKIIFTSGGTEGDNMAILGVAEAKIRDGNHIVTTSIEHHAVLNTCKYLESKGFEVTYVDPDENGIVNPESIKNAIKDTTILVSVMTANNETGVIQPINEIKKVCNNIILHTDAVQAYGKIDLKNINADIICVSAHKIHGPKGIGAIYIKKGTKIKPIMFGGNQDTILHSGTMNTPSIAAFGKSVEILMNNFHNNLKQYETLKLHLINRIKNIPEIKINGQNSVNVVNVSFKDVRGEVLLHSLEKDGIYVSTGSACNSKSTDISYVIKAMKVPRDYAEGTIRISFSEFNTINEIEYFIEKLNLNLNALRRFKRR